MVTVLWGCLDRVRRLGPQEQEAGSLSARCWQGCFFWGLSPWLAEGHFLSVTLRSSLWVCAHALVSSPHKNTRHFRLGPIFMALFELNHLFNGPLLETQAHLEILGARTQYKNWVGGDTVQLLTDGQPTQPSYAWYFNTHLTYEEHCRMYLFLRREKARPWLMWLSWWSILPRT